MGRLSISSLFESLWDLFAGVGRYRRSLSDGLWKQCPRGCMIFDFNGQLEQRRCDQRTRHIHGAPLPYQW